MEKKLITEMKFMMERLENPRLTYTEYEKKHNQLIKEDGPSKIPSRPSRKPFSPPPVEEPELSKSNYYKSKMPDSFNKFIETTWAEESSAYTDPNDFPSELKNIKYKFLGNKNNYAITKDGSEYNVYSWTRIYSGITKVGTFDTEEKAKDSIETDN
jgi:hypothetical protein